MIIINHRIVSSIPHEGFSIVIFLPLVSLLVSTMTVLPENQEMPREWIHSPPILCISGIGLCKAKTILPIISP